MAPITLSARNGQAITFSLYKDGVLVQSGLTMTEIGTTGEFWANMPAASAAGKYLVVFFDGAQKIASGELWWDGDAEIVPVPDGLATAAQVSSLATAVGTPLQASGYVAPDNAGIASIQASVEAIEPADLSGIPAAVRTELEATGSKLDKAMKAAQSAEDNTT